MATTSRRRGGIADQCVGEGRRPTGTRHRCRQPGLGVDDAAGVHLVGFVVLGRRIPHALAGDDVHDHGCVEAPRVAQRGLDCVLVVAVDRADVLQAEVGEHHLRRERVLDAGLDAVHALVADLADDRHLLDGLAALLEHPLVAGLQTKPRHVLGEAADRRRVAAAVVVDDDHHRPPGRGDVVQRLPAHTAGQGAVADDGDHVAVAVPGQLEGLGQSVGVRQRGAGVAGLHPVVLALAARGVARQAVLLAQRVEVVGATRQHLVHIGLMSGVEDDRIVRRIEHPVQGKGQLDHTEIGAEMPAGCSDLVNQEFADFPRQIAQLRLCQVLQICGTADLFKHSDSLRTRIRLSPVERRRRRAHRRDLHRRSRFHKCADTPRFGSTTPQRPVHLR